MDDDGRRLSLGLIALLALGLFVQRGPLVRYLKIERM
jgi:hypothetical protein